MPLGFCLIRHSHGETVQSRRATCLWTLGDFIVEFENQLYSRYHRKIKKHEFLTLKHGDIPMLEYKMRFHDLSMFAPHHVHIEQHMIKRFQDALR